METILCALLLTLVLLIYFSGRTNAINRRGAFAGFLFWLGLAKEAIAYNLIPFVERVLGIQGLGAAFLLPYSLMTWALYALAVPTAILFALAIGDEYPPPARRWLFYLPAAVISCVFHPWRYHAYQANSTAFWVVFAVYNILGCMLFAALMLRAVRCEADANARNQKRLVTSVLLPPVLYWVLSVFLTHPLHLTALSKLWQINALVLLASIVLYLISAFRGGMMGLRLTGESYRWNSDMGLIRRGASYTRHMIKNQTAKMAWCVSNLAAQFAGQGVPPPEELAILSRAIEALQAYTDKAALYANAIVLNEETHPLDRLIEDAFSLCVSPVADDISLHMTGVNGVSLRCDRAHMSEVFVNLFTNALEAMGPPAPIEVRAVPGRGKAAFTLHVIDHGVGIAPKDIAHIFAPYYTTKSTPGNTGLGLAYCKNVIQQHGGTLEARSRVGKGTTMVIRLPAERIRGAAERDGREGMRVAEPPYGRPDRG